MANKNESEREVRQNKIEQDNDMYLTGFAEWLANKGFSYKTINTHVRNVDFYINDYLCYDLLDVSQGCIKINDFLGDWFIRKTAWSSIAHIKSNAAGIKKFYEYLLEENVVTPKDYDCLCKTIKQYMPNWLGNMRRYEKWLFQDYYL